MAIAVLELFPETKLGRGPATDSGFFYDFYRPTPFTPDDFEKIEKKMAEIIARDEPFVHEFVPRDEGIADFKAADDFMKSALHRALHQARRGHLALSQWGVHRLLPRSACPSTGRVKAFKVMSWPEPTGWATRRISSCSASTDRLLHAEGSRRALQAPGRDQGARPSRAGQAARPVHHPGARWRGPDLLASQGRHDPQDHGRLDARRVIRRGYELVYTRTSCGASCGRSAATRFSGENMYRRWSWTTPSIG